MLNSVYNMTLNCISLFCGDFFNISSLCTQRCSRHHYKLDCFTDLVYRYYKDGRRPISPGQNRQGNPDH